MLSVLRLTAALLASITILGCAGVLALFVFAPAEVERYTSGTRPIQFYRELEADLLDDYSLVFGVAHNSGNSLPAARAAAAASADVVEIDVVMAGGKLYAGHDSPLPFVGEWLFRGPLLADVWQAAAGVPVTKLDLKETSPAYLERVITFLDTHDDGRPVIVSSRSHDVLITLQNRIPYVVRLLSVPNTATLDRLRTKPGNHYAIDGVTVRHSLLDQDSAAWLRDNGLLMLAWTVNDAPRMNELVRYGVDAITTDNLAILELLGGQERGGVILVRR